MGAGRATGQRPGSALSASFEKPARPGWSQTLVGPPEEAPTVPSLHRPAARLIGSPFKHAASPPSAVVRGRGSGGRREVRLDRPSATRSPRDAHHGVHVQRRAGRTARRGALVPAEGRPVVVRPGHGRRPTRGDRRPVATHRRARLAGPPGPRVPRWTRPRPRGHDRRHAGHRTPPVPHPLFLVPRARDPPPPPT